MASHKTRSRTVIILLGITAILTVALNATATKNGSTAALGDLPLTVGEFVGLELPVDQSTKDILETPNILMRSYAGPDGVRIDLSVVYYEQYRVYFHMPEGCMTGQGSVISSSERVNVGILKGENEPLIANTLVLKQTEGNEYVFYFFIAGDLITPSYPKMRLHLMVEHLKRRPTGAALVRFSTRTRERDEEIPETLSDFIEQMVPVLRPYLG